MNIEERVSFLEKQNKKLKLSNNISIFSLFLLLIFGFQQQYQMPDIIKAKKFVLIDENSKERAILTIDTVGDKKSPKLRFYNESNNIITSIGANSNDGYLSVTSLVANEKDSKKHDTLNLYLKSNEISLDSNNSNRCYFGYNNGMSSIVLQNSNNTSRAFFEVTDKYAKNVIANDKSIIANIVVHNKVRELIYSNDTICKSSFYEFDNNAFNCQEKLGDENNYYKIILHDLIVGSEYHKKSFGSVALGSGIANGGPKIEIISKAGMIDLGHSEITQKMGLNIDGNLADSNITNMFLGNILDEWDMSKEKYITKRVELVINDNDKANLAISRDIERDESNIVTYTSNNKSIGIINNASESKFYISKDYSDIYNAYVTYDSYSNVISSGYFINSHGLDIGSTIYNDVGSESIVSRFYIDDIANQKRKYVTTYKITSGTSRLSTKYYDDNGYERVIIGNASMKTNGRDYISPLQSIFLLNNKGNVIDQLGNK